MTTQTLTCWVLEDTERPWTANAERRWNHYKRAEVVRDTRERWGWLARAEGIPRLQRISVEATPLRVNARSMPDVAACYPAVKAAIDGLVDAGVVPDDGPFNVMRITFRAPEIANRDGLRLRICEEPD
jgi:crossover junction endodeoxyribonuclease RusA